MNYAKSLVILSLAWATAARAAAPEDLSKQFEAEKNWKNVTIEVPGVQGAISGVVADGGRLRMDAFDGPMQSAADITAYQWGIFKYRPSFEKNCREIGPSIALIREERNSYTLKMKTIPLSGAAFKVRYENGSTANLPGFANKFLPIGYFQVDIQSNANALIKETKLKIDKTQAALMQQLEDQKELIARNGEIELDLTSLDDLVCDLITGQVTLSITTNVHYDAARLERKEFLKPEDVGRIYGAASKDMPAKASPAQLKVLGPAYIALALPEVKLTMNELAPSEFLRLYLQLFDEVSGQARQLTSSNLVDIANKMARYSSVKTWSNPQYTAVLNKVEE